MPSRIALIFIATLLTEPALADANGSWVEVGVSHYNSDWQPRGSETGVRLAGQLRRGRWSAQGFYNSIDTKEVDLPIIRLRGLPFRNWHEAAIGYSLDVTDRTSIQMQGAYIGAQLYDDTLSGYATAVLLRHALAQRVSTTLRLSRMHLEESDWRVTGELVLQMSPRLSVVTRIDDFAEFDFTWYEVGARISFR